MEEDHRQALEWSLRAAAQGSVEAHFSLGDAYESGRGVDPSDAMAAVFYRVAANAGDAQAQWRLRNMCREGRGVPQNMDEAYKWTLLADPGWDGSVLKNDLILPEQPAAALTPAQLLDAQARAREWTEMFRERQK